VIFDPKNLTEDQIKIVKSKVKLLVPTYKFEFSLKKP